MDFLLQNQANLDLKRMELNLDGEKIKCRDDQGTSFCARVIVEETTRVPAGHEVLVLGSVKCQGILSGDAILEPVDGGELAQKGIMVARVLVDASEDNFPVRIFNPGQQDCVVRQGTMAGYITPVSEIDIEDNQDPSMKDMNQAPLPDHLVDLYERSKLGVQRTHHEQIAKLLCNFQDVFASSETDIGRTDKVRHKISTGDHAPIKERPRRFPPKEQAEIDRQIKQLLDNGMIEASDSPWASNVVLVKKKDGSKRFCVDYRRLNNLTVKDAYPIPRIDDSLDALGGSRWFSTLDLASGYWQVELDEEAQEKSAFVVRGGLYRWKVMPFGLCGAPSTFERLMERVLAGLHWETLLVYLDDVIVYAKTVEDELNRLATVFQRLREAGLKLKAKKCHLFKESVLYLGHVVSGEGISTDPEKIRAVKEWPTPTTVKEVQSFLGLASYYRRFIARFSNIARPLHRLTEKGQQFVWSEECEAAFQVLKTRLIEAPILAYPDPEQEYILDTDASNEGIGAVLSQLQGGRERVICYASRSLNKAERNYCTTRKELLAVVVFLKQFRQYIYGQKVTVRTDHGALRWLLNFRDIQGQMARWLQVIAEYDITIIHRAGRSHGNADSLSRKPCTDCKQCGSKDECPSVTVPTPESTVQNNLEDVAAVNTVTVEPSSNATTLAQAQANDPSMSWILDKKKKGIGRLDWSAMSSKSSVEKSYWRMWNQLELRHDVLCRRWESDQGDEIEWHTLLPESLRKEVIEELHGGKSSGHLGMKKTRAKVRMRFYWVGMDADIRAVVRKCSVCAQRKTPTNRKKAPLQQEAVGAPMERVAMDIVGPMPETERGNKYILVVGDYFSKWMEAYPIPDQTAETVAEKFVSEFVCRFGVPKVLHSDQGRNFESKVFKEMCDILGIDKTRTTPYHPQSDGLIEKFNHTLITTVSMLIEPHNRQRDWDLKVPLALFAYRSSPQESTGETPSMLMLGRELSLPIDLTMEAPRQEETVDSPSETDYAYQLRKRMQRAHQRARENLAESARRQKRTYDQKAEGSRFGVGDFVWLHNTARTKGLSPKLQRRWHGPYLIVGKLSDVTYRIQQAQNGKKRVVHVDRMKPYLGEPLRSWITEADGGSDAPIQEQDHHDPQATSESAQDEAKDPPEAKVPEPQDFVDTPTSPAPSPVSLPRRYPSRMREPPRRYCDM